MAAVVNGWIDATPWMQRDLPAEEIAAMIARGLTQRDMWVIGEPAQAYVSVESGIGHVWGLYAAAPGQGLGKRLMDRVKEGRDFLSLNTHVPNLGAQRFHAREGFVAMGEVEPAGATSLSQAPARTRTDIRELRMEWRR